MKIKNRISGIIIALLFFLIIPANIYAKPIEIEGRLVNTWVLDEVKPVKKGKTYSVKIAPGNSTGGVKFKVPKTGTYTVTISDFCTNGVKKSKDKNRLNLMMFTETDFRKMRAQPDLGCWTTFDEIIKGCWWGNYLGGGALAKKQQKAYEAEKQKMIDDYNNRSIPVLDDIYDTQGDVIFDMDEELRWLDLSYQYRFTETKGKLKLKKGEILYLSLSGYDKYDDDLYKGFSCLVKIN